MTAIEPPDYFPGLPYAALLTTASSCVIDSRFQYSRQSFQNRARLRTPEGFQWISVPLTNGQFGRSISDVQIDYDQNWVSRHLKALRFNYASTPFYDHYIPEITELLMRQPETLGLLSTASVQLVHRFLNCQCELRVVASLNFSEGSQEVSIHPDGGGISDGEVRIVQLENRVPVHKPGNDRTKQAGQFIRVNMQPYRQNFDGFEPEMSVLDILFNHGPAARGMLERSTTLLETTQ